MPGAHGQGCGCKPENEFNLGEFLFGYIDVDGVRGINEQETGSARRTIRPYDERLNDSVSCKSEEGDAELVTSLVVIGGDRGRAPSKVKIFANRDDVDFTNVRDVECIQEVELTTDFHGAVEYPLKVTKLQNTSSIVLYFPENFGGDCTEIFYIGLRGVGSNYRREAVQTVYEARANMKDHKQPEGEFQAQMGL
ncbi:hypothetical protein, conserved [Eimeria tenella]|uniref:PITH domain-containing protein n=1 Tax=Eimeria tenella TaxID=5802 RepID=U6KYQ4_EIMTE|nr:hypothetical protein, conserved [Eimeria tenella]CDJ41429.1 hypothetical protein, conserved [Eimeria tenella]|eukprot:XP_013232179.1 hypothetical protein, conserved [Eimeria tenella]